MRNYTFQGIDRFSIDFCAVKGLPSFAEILRRRGRSRSHGTAARRFPLFQAALDRVSAGRRAGALHRLLLGIPRGRGRLRLFARAPACKSSHGCGSGSVPEVAYTGDLGLRRVCGGCKRFYRYAVLGGAWGWFFEAACELVGMDTWFLLVHDNPEVAHAILRRSWVYGAHLRDYVRQAGPDIDICFTGDDYGFQTGPMMNSRLFDEFARPYLYSHVRCREAERQGGDALWTDIPVENIAAMYDEAWELGWMQGASDSGCAT